MSKTPQQTSPAPLTMENLYNTLMFEIEPELVTDSIPLLDELYKDESKEERAERGQRYAAALQEFQRRLQDLVQMWKDDLSSCKKMILRYLQNIEADRKESDLSSIEQSIQENE